MRERSLHCPCYLKCHHQSLRDRVWRIMGVTQSHVALLQPFLMAALLIFKLFIPFLLVICVFSAITKLNRLPRLACYFLVILFSDVMTMHFFFLVRNTGSWMEIGNSISHFGIMSAQVVFVLLLFALTNIYTKDIDIGSVDRSSRKAM